MNFKEAVTSDVFNGFDLMLCVLLAWVLCSLVMGIIDVTSRRKANFAYMVRLKRNIKRRAKR